MQTTTAAPSTKSAKFTVHRKDLLGRLRPVAKCRSVFLSVNGSVELIGSDALVGIDSKGERVWNPGSGLEVLSSADWERDGELSALIDAAKLQRLLSKLKADVIDVQLNNEGKDWTVRVAAAHSAFTLDATDPADSPKAEPVDSTFRVLLDANNVRRMIQETIYATDIESSRYALGGIYVELSAHETTFCATDSRRMAFASSPSELDGIIGDESATYGVIPTEAMRLVLSQIPKTDGTPIVIALDHFRFAISSDGWCVRGKLVDGRFPRWRDVVPADWNFTLTTRFDRKLLLESVDTAALCTDDYHRAVTFSVNGDTVTLESKSDAIGRSETNLLADTNSQAGANRAVTVQFDPRWLIDYLKVTDAATVEMRIVNSESAVVFTADGHATAVIMPLSQDR